MSAPGAKPPGAADESRAALWVRQMFADIAPTYDLLNHLLSFNIDKSWRKALLRRLQATLDQPSALVLDLCCGTGDVLLALRANAKAHVIGADFCHPMLLAAQRKARQRSFHASLFEGDAMELPLAGGCLDAISIAFGYRNLVHYENALLEFRRVLKPGGTLAILEFSHPPGAFMRNAYNFYSRVVLPAAGALISGSRQAYAYLPESVGKFPPAPELRTLIERCGFADASYRLLTGGIAALHSGVKR